MKGSPSSFSNESLKHLTEKCTHLIFNQDQKQFFLLTREEIKTIIQ